MQVIVINKSDYGRGVAEVPVNSRIDSHQNLNQTVVDGAIQFLQKKAKMKKMVHNVISSDKFKDFFRYLMRQV